MKIGFEKEYFVMCGNNVLVAAQLGLPHDGCGYLAEARGEPNSCPIQAAYSLMAEELKIERKLTHGQYLDTTSRKLSHQFKRNCIRDYGKRPQTDYSMSGKWNKSNLSHAGLHIHFSSTYTITDRTGVAITIPKILNIPAIVRFFDVNFKDEIKAEKRALGLYKIKDYGFEYRSLPASLSITKVAEFITLNFNKIKNFQ